MYHRNAEKTLREKVKRELHKNPTSYIEQILEATPHKALAVRPIAFHH